MISCKNNPKKRKRKTHGQLSKSKLKEHFQSQPFVTISPCITFFCIFFKELEQEQSLFYNKQIDIESEICAEAITKRMSYTEPSLTMNDVSIHLLCWPFPGHAVRLHRRTNSHQPETFHHGTTREPWPSINRRSETR